MNIQKYNRQRQAKIAKFQKNIKFQLKAPPAAPNQSMSDTRDQLELEQELENDLKLVS